MGLLPYVRESSRAGVFVVYIDLGRVNGAGCSVDASSSQRSGEAHHTGGDMDVPDGFCGGCSDFCPVSLGDRRPRTVAGGSNLNRSVMMRWEQA